MLITCWSHVGHMLVTLGFPSGTWKPYESNLGPLKTGSEVCLVYRNSHRKLRKYFQLLRRKLPRSNSACVPSTSRIFASFPQSATIRPIYSAFMWFVEQAWLHFFQNFDRCRRSPVWRWKHLQLQRHALVCHMMHHCATDLTEPCRPDDQCDNAIDGHLYVMDLFCQLGIVRNNQSQCWSHVEHFGMFFGNMKNWKTKPFWEISAKIIAECWVLSSEPRSL